MAILSREAFLQARARTETVEVPELGGEVVIRELTVGQQMDIANSVKGRPDAETQTLLKVFIEGVAEPHFEPADFNALRETSASAVQRIVDRIVTLSGMTKPEQGNISGK